MEKLTKEDIQFIDNYLIKSGVIYIDIRTEMLDHIATAVEARMQSENDCFYDAFKAYMIENKKSLLDSQSIFVKQVRKNLFSDFIKLFYYKNSLFVLLLIIPLATYSYNTILKPYFEEYLVEVVAAYWFLFMVLIAIQRIYLKFKFQIKTQKENKLSTVSSVVIVANFMFYGLVIIQKLIMKFNNMYSTVAFIMSIYAIYNLTQLFYTYQLKYLKTTELC